MSRIVFGRCLKIFLENILQGPPGQKGDQGATEIIDYNGNIHEALQVCKHNKAGVA